MPDYDDDDSFRLDEETNNNNNSSQSTETYYDDDGDPDSHRNDGGYDYRPVSPGGSVSIKTEKKKLIDKNKKDDKNSPSEPPVTDGQAYKIWGYDKDGKKVDVSYDLNYKGQRFIEVNGKTYKLTDNQPSYETSSETNAGKSTEDEARNNDRIDTSERIWDTEELWKKSGANKSRLRGSIFGDAGTSSIDASVNKMRNIDAVNNDPELTGDRTRYNAFGDVIGTPEDALLGNADMGETKQEKIAAALKYRGIGYLKFLTSKGVLSQDEFEKYSKQIQETRDIRRPAMRKALNMAYMIYNTIATGFQNVSKLAANMAGIAPTEFNKSAMANALDESFKSALDVEKQGELKTQDEDRLINEELRQFVVESKGDWRKFSQDKVRAILENWFGKNAERYKELLNREHEQWQDAIALNLGAFLNNLPKEQQENFISGLFAKQSKVADNLMLFIAGGFVPEATRKMMMANTAFQKYKADYDERNKK